MGGVFSAITSVASLTATRRAVVGLAESFAVQPGQLSPGEVGVAQAVDETWPDSTWTATWRDCPPCDFRLPTTRACDGTTGGSRSARPPYACPVETLVRRIVEPVEPSDSDSQRRARRELSDARHRFDPERSSRLVTVQSAERDRNAA